MTSLGEDWGRLAAIQATVRSLIGGRGSLRRRTIFSSNWLIAKSVGMGLLDLTKTAIFARVLFAEDYGLMALAVMATGLLESFSATGIDILIQRDDEKYIENLNGYWTINLCRGLLLFSLAWLIAPVIADYYEHPELIALIRVLGLMFLFNGLAGFGREVRQREMRFGAVAIADIIAATVVLVMSLVILFVLQNVWVLVLFNVLTAFGRMVVSYALFPWRPSIKFDRGLLKNVALFASAIIALQALNYLFNNFDRAVIGKIFDVEQLGYYGRGYFLALVPVTYFGNVISPIFLPAFREIAEDPARIRPAFWKTVGIFALLFTLLGAGLFILARPFVLIVYGERWLPVLPVFRILIIFGVSKGIVTVLPSIFFLKAKPWLITISAGFMVATIGIICFPLIDIAGVKGAAWAVVIAGVASHILSFILAIPLLKAPKTVERSGSL